MKKHFVLFATLIISINIYSQVVASGKALVGYFLYNMELDIADPENIEQKKQTTDNIMAILFSEAYYVYSGMIYGYRFTYRFDNPNPLESHFELKLIGNIDDKDKRLKTLSYKESGMKATLETRYYLTEDQKQRFNIREHSNVKQMMARGTAKADNSVASRIKAIEDSLKKGILDEAKRKYKERPFSLSGEIFFTELPHITIKNGEYNALTQSVIKIDQVDKQLAI